MLRKVALSHQHASQLPNISNIHPKPDLGRQCLSGCFHNAHITKRKYGQVMYVS